MNLGKLGMISIKIVYWTSYYVIILILVVSVLSFFITGSLRASFIIADKLVFTQEDSASRTSTQIPISEQTGQRSTSEQIEQKPITNQSERKPDLAVPNMAPLNNEADKPSSNTPVKLSDKRDLIYSDILDFYDKLITILIALIAVSGIVTFIYLRGLSGAQAEKIAEKAIADYTEKDKFKDLIYKEAGGVFENLEEGIRKSNEIEERTEKNEEDIKILVEKQAITDSQEDTVDRELNGNNG